MNSDDWEELCDELTWYFDRFTGAALPALGGTGDLTASLFAGATLVLVAVGIYGVMACAVTERTQEIGIRMALGAPRGGVLRMVVGQSLALTAAGVLDRRRGCGGLTRLLKGFLFEVSPVDPLTFAAVSAIVLMAALLASALPGLRATRVDPGHRAPSGEVAAR